MAVSQHIVAPATSQPSVEDYTGLVQLRDSLLQQVKTLVKEKEAIDNLNHLLIDKLRHLGQQRIRK